MYGIDKNVHLPQIKELKIRVTALKGCKGAHNRYFRWINLFESDTVKDEYLEQERILLSTPLVMEWDDNTRWHTFTNEHRLSLWGWIIQKIKTDLRLSVSSPSCIVTRYHAIAWEMTGRRIANNVVWDDWIANPKSKASWILFFWDKKNIVGTNLSCAEKSRVSTARSVKSRIDTNLRDETHLDWVASVWSPRIMRETTPTWGRTTSTLNNCGWGTNNWRRCESRWDNPTHWNVSEDEESDLKLIWNPKIVSCFWYFLNNAILYNEPTV